MLHSVPLGDGHGRVRGDVDHLVIGPPGLVSINTKHHGAQVNRATCPALPAQLGATRRCTLVSEFGVFGVTVSVSSATNHSSPTCQRS